jgi:Carboxypeptidase regulatory-like domain
MQLFTRRVIIVGLTVPPTLVFPRNWKRALRRTSYPKHPAPLVCASLLLCMVPTNALAQRTAALGINRSLPDAPLPQSGPQSSAEQTSSAEGSASVSGTVLDTTGAVVPGAQVSLTQRDGKTLHTLVSGANGEFTFTKLPVSSYLVIINAKGFAPFTSAEFAVTEQQSYEVPNISLSVGMASTEVTVRPTEAIAAEQIKAEEKQRLIGVVPNFYVSYVHDAAPLTSKQKFSLASHDTLDWTSFVGISVAAGIEQANNSYAGYGQGAAGYGKRWAARFGDGRSSDFLGHAIFPSLFHQDPRYFYQGTGSKKSRLYHALSHPFIARSDSGKNMPNYSYLLGDMCSGALSNAYYPHADRGANLVFTNAFVGLAGLAGTTVLQEFLGKRLTKNVPDDGKP